MVFDFVKHVLAHLEKRLLLFAINSVILFMTPTLIDSMKQNYKNQINIVNINQHDIS